MFISQSRRPTITQRLFRPNSRWSLSISWLKSRSINLIYLTKRQLLPINTPIRFSSPYNRSTWLERVNLIVQVWNNSSVSTCGRQTVCSDAKGLSRTREESLWCFKVLALYSNSEVLKKLLQTDGPSSSWGEALMSRSCEVKLINVKIEGCNKLIEMTEQFLRLRANMYNRRMDKDKLGQASDTRQFMHSLLATIMTRGVILGPFDRIKLIH